MSSADQPPNPFSREGSSPEDQPPGEARWPNYQSRPEPTEPAGGDPYGQPPTSEPPNTSYHPQQFSPYASPSDSPYGPPSYPSMPPYAAEQPYGRNYGDSPYEVTPYQPSFGSATPYQPDYGTGTPYDTPAVQHPQAIIAMVLGILGLAVCPLIGIAGLVLGSKARKEIDASAGRFAGRGMATAGFVLGIISVVVTVLVILAIILGVAGAFGA
jgi:Domain of unknown function (DUF4190)